MNREKDYIAPAAAGKKRRCRSIGFVPETLLRMLEKLAGPRKKSPVATADSLAVWSPEND